MRDSAVWLFSDAAVLLAGSVDFLHEAALTTSCGIGVDDPLCCCFVEALHGEANIFGVLRASCTRDGVLHAGAKFALDRLVALLALGVGKDALFLALDVCHVERG